MERKIKRVAVFDFDGTLVDTPIFPKGKKLYKEATGKDWPHQGWWGRPESLDTDVFEMPVLEDVIADYKTEKESEDTLVVLLTGRIQKIGKEVRKVVDSKGLEFDEYYFNNTGKPTIEFKIGILDKLLKEYPDAESFALWDDRVEHVDSFIEWGDKLEGMGKDFEFTKVEGKYDETFNGPQD